MVRFEVDAALDTSIKKSDDPDPEKPSLGSTPTLHVKPHYKPHTPQEGYVDIKVLPANTDLDLVGVYTGMVYSQTPRICIAQHSKGHFPAPEILELHGVELRQVATEQEPILAKVVALSRKITDTTTKYGRVAVVCNEGVISLYKMPKRESPALSREAVEMIIASAQTQGE